MHTMLRNLSIATAFVSLLPGCLTMDDLVEHEYDGRAAKSQEPADPPVSPQLVSALANPPNDPEPDEPPPANIDLIPPKRNPSQEPEPPGDPVDDVYYVPAVQEEQTKSGETTTKSHVGVGKYRIWRSGTSVVWYTTPSGYTLGLDTSTCLPDTWCCTRDLYPIPDRAICYYNYSTSEDDILQFTLQNAHSIDCTLLYSENDQPDKIYMSTDSGNNCVGEYGCFAMREAGNTYPPVDPWDQFKIACF